MTGYGFYGALRVFLAPGLIVFFAIFAVGSFAYQQHAKEQRVRQEYGAGWEKHYEERYGPLREHRQKIAVGVGSLVIIAALGFFTYRQFAPAKAPKRRY